MITIILTIEDIKDIYEAGIRRGEEQQSSYDWGSTPYGQKFDECISALYDIVNKNKNSIDHEDYIHYSEVESWFEGLVK